MREKVELSKSGLPVMWEWGGGYSNTGEAQIICGKNFEKKHAIYVRRKGSLACAEHALFVVQKGDHIIRASHHRGDFDIKILRIRKILGDQLYLEEVTHLSEERQNDLDGTPAILMAKEKAQIYHCRHAVYANIDL